MRRAARRCLLVVPPAAIAVLLKLVGQLSELLGKVNRDWVAGPFVAAFTQTSRCCASAFSRK